TEKSDAGATETGTNADASATSHDAASAPSQTDAATDNDGGPAQGDASLPTGACPDALVGWASMAGDGVDTTTGGGSAPPGRPKDADELKQYASESGPRVIEIAGEFSVEQLDVSSDKTLVGVDPNAIIHGGVRVRGKDGAPVHNVILRNLRVDGGQSAEDAVQ